jgi:Emfourin
MTTITFKRSGGFVGKGMRLQVQLDELPSNDARALIRLIEKAQFFNIPENLIVKFNPDEYQYTITIDAGVICHTVRTNDTTMPASLRPLVDELSSLQTYAQ